MSSLPVLRDRPDRSDRDWPNLEIAAPCDERWDEMTGDQKRRFCGACEEHVYNFEHMTVEEICALLERPQTPCVRFFRRADGTVLTADCPVGLRERFARLRRRVLGGGAAAVLGGLAWLAGSGPGPRPPLPVLMGTPLPPEPPPREPTPRDMGVPRLPPRRRMGQAVQRPRKLMGKPAPMRRD